MNILIPKRKLLIALPMILIAVLIVYSACKKQYGEQTENLYSNVENARSWFVNTILKNEKEMLSKPFTELPKDSRARIFARMAKLNAKLNWNKAKEYIREGIQYVVTPLEETAKPLKNKNFETGRSMVFYKDNSGAMRMNVIEVLSTKGNTLGFNVQEICNIAFTNMQLEKSDNINNVSASIIFYDEEYNHKSSFQVTQGKWSISKIHLNNLKGATTKRRIASTMSQPTTCQTCTNWYLVGFWYDNQSGQVLDYEILDQWEECTQIGPPSGGYGDGNEPPDDECLANCISVANSLSDGAQVVSETLDIDIGTIDLMRKYKNPKWKILKNLTWSLNSQEFGVVKLVDVQTNKWQWESLTHGPITKEGTHPGGAITFTQGVGTPSFFPGTPNVLYAGMSVKFEVTYSPGCDCPGISNVIGVIAPYTEKYTANAIWDAKF